MVDNMAIAVHAFTNTYIDIALSRWDIATEVYEQVC